MVPEIILELVRIYSTIFNNAKMNWKTHTPNCYKTGDWDGKMSDLLLLQDSAGEYHLGHCYRTSV